MSVIIRSSTGVDDDTIWNLGLKRIKGSATAIRCKKTLISSLNDVGLDLQSNIACIVSDGAAVMTCLGKHCFPASQQLCYAHAIQLAVLDVLYSIKLDATFEFAEENFVNEDDDDRDDLESFLNSVTEEEEADERLQLEQEIEFDDQMDITLKSLLKKVRKIVRIFRKSPLENESLQEFVEDNHGKGLNLILDVRTRWNSLHTMLERFVLLKSSIQKAVVDLKEPIEISNNEFKILKELLDALTPIKLTVEALCKQNTNLIMADTAFKFMFRELKIQNSLMTYWKR